MTALIALSDAMRPLLQIAISAALAVYFTGAVVLFGYFASICWGVRK